MSCQSFYRLCSPGGSSQVTSIDVCSPECKQVEQPSDHQPNNSCHSMTRNTEDKYVMQSHVDKHVHLTNCIHMKNKFHFQKREMVTMEEQHLGQLSLFRELIALSRIKSLRDPSTYSAVNSPQRKRRSLSEHIGSKLDGAFKEAEWGDRIGGIQERHESRFKERAGGDRARQSKPKDSRRDQDRSRQDLAQVRTRNVTEVRPIIGEIFHGGSKWDGNISNYIGGAFGDKRRVAKLSQARDHPRSVKKKSLLADKEQVGDTEAAEASHVSRVPAGTLNSQNEFYERSHAKPFWRDLRQSRDSKDVEGFVLRRRNLRSFCSSESSEELHTDTVRSLSPLSLTDSIDDLQRFDEDLSLLEMGDQNSDGDSSKNKRDGEISPLEQQLVALRLRLRSQSQSQSPLLARNAIRKRCKNKNGSRKPQPRNSFKAIVNDVPVPSRGRHSFASAKLAAIPPYEDDTETKNGCGIPRSWSRLHKHKGKSSLDATERMLSYGYPKSSKKAEVIMPGAQFSLRRLVDIPTFLSERSFSSLNSDPESLPIIQSDLPWHRVNTTSFLEKIENILSPAQNLGIHSGDQNDVRGEGFERIEFSVSRMERIDDGRKRCISQKYRPKSFKELVGQTLVVQTLSNALLKGNIASLYIFQGPRGTGKTCAARIFACALVCVSTHDLKPCGSCRECVNLEMRNYMDVVEVDSTSLNMKRLLDYMLLPPSATFRICIIDECHLLAMETWNMLLKNLEEPPAHAIFILVTASPEQLPHIATSRCQKLCFKKIDSSVMIARLRELARKENVEVEQDALELITLRADGSLRDAETTLDQLCLLGDKITLQNVQELAGLIPEEKLLQLLDMAMSGQTMATVKITRELLLSGLEAVAVISQLATLIKKILSGSYNTGQMENKSRLLAQKHLTKKVLSRLQQAMKILSESEKQIRASNDPTTWLTASLLQFTTDPTPVSRTSSARATVMPSIVADSDANESGQNAGTQIALDSHEHFGLSLLENPGNVQSETKSEDKRKPIVSVRNSKQYALKPGPSGKKMKGYSLSLSACTADSSDHSSPCMNSVCELNSSFSQNKLSANLSLAHETPEIATINSNKLSAHKSHAPMHQQKMADVWRRVLQRSRSKVVKQLLKYHGDLTSLSFTEGYAVAYIEFKHPQQKLRAKRSVSSISQAFQAVLGYPVEVRITMASFSTKSERIKIDNTLSFGPECNTPFQHRMVKTCVPGNTASVGSKTNEEHSQLSLQDPTVVAHQGLESDNIHSELHAEQRTTADERTKKHLYHAKEVDSPSLEHLENAWVQDNHTPALLKQDHIHFQRRLESRMKKNGFLCWNVQKSSERQANQARRWHGQKGFFRKLVPCGRVRSLLKKRHTFV